MDLNLESQLQKETVGPGHLKCCLLPKININIEWIMVDGHVEIKRFKGLFINYMKQYLSCLFDDKRLNNWGREG